MTHDMHVMRLAVRAYLLDVKAKMNALKDITERTQVIKESMEGVSSPVADAAPSGSNDRMTNGLIKLQTLEEQYKTASVEFESIVNQAYNICFSGGLERQVIWLHEVDRKSWDVVGKELGYSRSSVKRMSETGYMEVYYLMPEEYRRSAFPNAMPKQIYT